VVARGRDRGTIVSCCRYRYRRQRTLLYSVIQIGFRMKLSWYIGEIGKRFSVAITHAKALLIIVGNPFQLSFSLHATSKSAVILRFAHAFLTDFGWCGIAFFSRMLMEVRDEMICIFWECIGFFPIVGAAAIRRQERLEIVQTRIAV